MRLTKRRRRMAGTIGGECMRYRRCSFARAVCVGSALLMLSAVATVVTAEQQPKIEVVPVIGHADTVSSVAFAPDGASVLSSSGDRTLKLWNVATGQLIRSFTGHRVPSPLEDVVSAVAFAPDGARVLSCSWDGTLKLWDAATGQLIRSFTGHAAFVASVAFAPDGARVLSGSWDRTLKLWDAATGQLIRSFTGHRVPSPLEDVVSEVAFAPDGAR